MKSNGIRRKRPSIKVKLEIAQYLTLRWAPGAELRILKTKDPGITIHHAEDPGPDTIQWSLDDGLTKLLHEIGHYRICRRRSAVEGNLSRPEIIAEEARAWAWAEWAARQENIFFDYSQASHCFDSYTVGSKAREYIPMRVRWHYWGRWHNEE